MKKGISSTDCQVCKELFGAKDLFPVHLIRNKLFIAAKKQYPDLTIDGFVCYPDLRKIGVIQFEAILLEDKGEISEIEQEVLDSIKEQDILSDNINEEFEESLTLGDRLADHIARFGGSWKFIIGFGVVLFGWMAINSVQLLRQDFDPFPFIFLNLVLSCLAAIQAPVIMMSQNRQSKKDRLSQENDYQVNLKAELQIRQLNSRLELFMTDQFQKNHDFLRLQQEIIYALESKK